MGLRRVAFIYLLNSALLYFLVIITVMASLAIRCYSYRFLHQPTHCKEAVNPTLLPHYHFHNQHLHSYTVTGS